MEKVKETRRLKLLKKPDAPLPERVAKLAAVSAGKRLRLVMKDVEPVRLVQALHPLFFYHTLREAGVADALEFLEMGDNAQILFCLDLELWDGSSLDREKTLEWFGYLMETGEERMRELLHDLDPEALIVLLKREILVGGGGDDLLADEERLAGWDHSFDGLFMITFRDPESSRLVGTFLDLLYRTGQPLYVELMEGVKHETEAEMEDLALRFRNARLADLGFPERGESLEVYAPLAPEKFRAPASKPPVCGGDAEWLALYGAGTEQGALRSAPLQEEFAALAARVLMAEEGKFADAEKVTTLLQRVEGYLDIALQRLSGGDAEKAARVLESVPLKELFRLACGILRGLRRDGGNASTSPEGEAVLQGLRPPAPLFWRGLDPDGGQGYREFRGMQDVETVARFLASHREAPPA